MVDYRIPREELARVFKQPRYVSAFEKMQVRIESADSASAAAVAATEKLVDASFITLSANAELPNERVLKFGTGIGYALTDTELTLALTNDAARSEGGFRITLVAAGDAVLGVPLTGNLATKEWATATFTGGTGGLSRAKGRFVYGS